MVKFNGTLGFPSEFTGDPSPELDAVWDKWGYGLCSFSYYLPTSKSLNFAN